VAGTELHDYSDWLLLLLMMMMGGRGKGRRDGE